MPQENRTFPATEPITAIISDGSGSIELHATDTDQVSVEIDSHNERILRETVIEFAGNVLRIKPPDRRFGSTPGLDIRVTVPERSSAKINSGSADVECSGVLTDLTVNTGSGDVRAEHIIGDARMKSGSGDVEIDSVDGTADLTSASGDVRLASAGHAVLGTASGDISVLRVESSVHANTASGSVEVASVSGPATLRGVSGDIRVGLAAGLAARLDVSSLTGDVSSELPVSDQAAAGDPVDIAAHTVSGDISIRRAAAVSSV